MGSYDEQQRSSALSRAESRAESSDESREESWAKSGARSGIEFLEVVPVLCQCHLATLQQAEELSRSG
jgi:hypothetical protein